jgi:hypothetical protein
VFDIKKSKFACKYTIFFISLQEKREKIMNDTQVKTNSPKAWLLAARPKTLTGAAVPVMIGTALALTDAPMYGEGAFSWTAAALCMLFAFTMHFQNLQSLLNFFILICFSRCLDFFHLGFAELLPFHLFITQIYYTIFHFVGLYLSCFKWVLV